MAISINKDINAGFLMKWMSVKKMKEIISGLSDDYDLYPNAVGNLSVLNGEKMIGYIDFGTETVENVWP